MLAKQAEEISESKQKVMDANMRSSNVAEVTVDLSIFKMINV